MSNQDSASDHDGWRIEINAKSARSNVFILADFSDLVLNLSAYLADSAKNFSNFCVITDDEICKLFPELIAKLTALGALKIISVPRSESGKTLAVCEDLYQEFFNLKLDRQSLVLALGGGAICDLTGFAASTYLRGLKLAYIPTTLLSQVDASVGGKNGVNFAGTKNLVGTIVQADSCFICVEFLQALPEIEYLSGLAEIIKHAAIADAALFADLESSSKKILDRDSDLMRRIIRRSVQIKARIVELDEQENAERRLLNFGHTIGHALEVSEKIQHGMAVAVGMYLEAKIAAQLGYCTAETVSKLTNLLKTLELPLSRKAPPQQILELILHDKKRYQDYVKFIMLREIGRAEVYQIKISDLKKLIYDLCLAC